MKPLEVILPKEIPKTLKQIKAEQKAKLKEFESIM